MLRTVHFYHDYSPIMGGSYSSVQQFLHTFAPPDFGSHVISFDAEPITSDDGCPITSQSHHVRTRQNIVSRYYRHIRTRDAHPLRELCSSADAIFVHLLYRHHAVVAARMAKAYRKPLYVVPHGSLDPYCFTYRSTAKRLWLEYYKDVLVSPATFIFATCQEAKKAEATIGRVKSTVLSWPCTLADDVPRNLYPTRRTGPLKLLFVGRLHPMKRVLETVRAALTVGPQRCSLTVVGPPSAEVSANAVLSLARTTQDESVSYRGAVFGDALIDLYTQSDGLVLFSHRENFGHVVAEAMSCGRPVFVSNDVDLAPLVTSTGSGLAFQIKRERDIVDALGQITRLSTEDLRQMGRNARQVAQREFSVNTFTRRLSRLVQEAVRKGSTSSDARSDG